MAFPNEIPQILKRIEQGNQTQADIQQLQEYLKANANQAVQQFGKYNINIGNGQDIQVGDRYFVEINDEAIQAIIRAIQAEGDYPEFEGCSERHLRDQYLEAVLQRLRRRGCLHIRQNIVRNGRVFNYIARISDFEPGLGMRGEAFFLFSEFPSLQMPTFKQFSGQCLQWSKAMVEPAAAGQAVFNFRIPTHLCFAIALVDHLDDATRTAIRTTNPIDHRVDLLWYEVPVVYELKQQALHFYEKPANFFDHFKGEVAWSPLRSVIKEILAPP